MERVNDSDDDDCGPSTKKKAKGRLGWTREVALHLAEALDGYAIAEVGSRIVHVRVRCDAIVQKVKCADANGPLKVKVSSRRIPDRFASASAATGRDDAGAALSPGARLLDGVEFLIDAALSP